MAQRSKQVTRYGYKRGGKWAINPQFEAAAPFHHGLAAVMLNGTWGYVDSNGAIAIEPRFFRAGPFFDGLFAHVELERNRVAYVDQEQVPQVVQQSVLHWQELRHHCLPVPLQQRGLLPIFHSHCEPLLS